VPLASYLLYTAAMIYSYSQLWH